MNLGIATAGVGGALLAGGPIVEAVRALYGMGVAINDFVDTHIDQMKQSENPTICRTGFVLEAAKFGFGLGYMSSVVIMATGQFLMGNTFAALQTVATAGALTNPIAMTCAAVGAIYYGWHALDERERNEITTKLVTGLGVGAELIKSVIQLVCGKIKELMSSENISELKLFIKKQAEYFGKSLYDVTGAITDHVKNSATKAIDGAIQMAEKTGNAVGKLSSQAATATSTTIEEMKVKAAGGLEKTSAKIDALFKK
jgi:hypothetical protein